MIYFHKVVLLICQTCKLNRVELRAQLLRAQMPHIFLQYVCYRAINLLVGIDCPPFLLIYIEECVRIIISNSVRFSLLSSR